MRPRTWILGTLALVSLAGLGFASAHAWGRGGTPAGPGTFAYRGEDGTFEQCPDDMTVGACRALRGDPCNDAMTIGECKAALEARRAEREAERMAKCVERTGNQTLCEERAARGPPPGHGPRRGPHGHGGPGPRGPPPEPRDPDA